MIKLLSERLCELRIAKNMSQKQVAKLVGVDPSTISTYENATRAPSYPVLIRLSKVYGVSVDYLLGVEREKFPRFPSDMSDKTQDILSEIAEVLVRHLGK